MLYPHVYHAAIVGLAVKFRVNFDPALAKFFFYVIGKFNVSAVNTGYLSYLSLKFIHFFIHIRKAYTQCLARAASRIMAETGD